MFATLLALSFLPVSQAADGPTRTSLSQTIYYASTAASGSRFYDRKRSARYGQQFKKRYGSRIAALLNYHIKTSGLDPDFFVTSSCRQSFQSGSRQNEQHANALSFSREHFAILNSGLALVSTAANYHSIPKAGRRLTPFADVAGCS